MKTFLEITFKNISPYDARIFKEYRKVAIYSGVFDLETSFFFILFLNLLNFFFIYFLLQGKMIYPLFVGCVLYTNYELNKDNSIKLKPGRYSC